MPDCSSCSFAGASISGPTSAIVPCCIIRAISATSCTFHRSDDGAARSLARMLPAAACLRQRAVPVHHARVVRRVHAVRTRSSAGPGLFSSHTAAASRRGPRRPCGRARCLANDEFSQPWPPLKLVRSSRDVVDDGAHAHPARHVTAYAGSPETGAPMPSLRASRGCARASPAYSEAGPAQGVRKSLQVVRHGDLREGGTGMSYLADGPVLPCADGWRRPRGGRRTGAASAYAGAPDRRTELVPAPDIVPVSIETKNESGCATAVQPPDTSLRHCCQVNSFAQLDGRRRRGDRAAGHRPGGGCRPPGFGVPRRHPEFPSRHPAPLRARLPRGWPAPACRAMASSSRWGTPSGEREHKEVASTQQRRHLRRSAGLLGTRPCTPRCRMTASSADRFEPSPQSPIRRCRSAMATASTKNLKRLLGNQPPQSSM